MQNNSLIDQGLELMLYGMGMVFVFLALLIVVTILMSAMVQRFGPVEKTEPVARSGMAASSDNTLIAVISAAIHKHRSK